MAAGRHATDALQWTGSTRPKDPDRGIGFVTGVAVGSGKPGPKLAVDDSPARPAAPARPRPSRLLEGEDAAGAGMRVAAAQMGNEKEPVETIRSCGRVRMTRG